MRRDPLWRSETQAWLDKSNEDLEAAALLAGAAKPVLAPALFHCQQAAEKALKGFLVWHGETFRKTHDIEEIGTQVRAVDPSLGPLLDRAADLSLFAYKFRYPGQPPSPDAREVQDYLALAREVNGAITERLDSDWSS